MRYTPRLLSLRSIGALILLALFLPSLAFSVLGFFNAKAEEESLEQIRDRVNDYNQMINQSVSSPFYMSPRTFDPCNPKSLTLVNYPANWEIEYRYSGDSQVTCEWIYYKDGEKFAVDKWSDYDRKLVSRIYFQHGTQILATEAFFILDDTGRVKCVKQREYENFNIAECYSEAGKLISINPTDRRLSSPLPPMLYWFSYR